MNKKEKLEQKIKELKEQLKEEKKKERIRKINEYKKMKYKQKVFYVPREEENPDWYIFLKLAKKLGIRTFKKENDYKIYHVADEVKKSERTKKSE